MEIYEIPIYLVNGCKKVYIGMTIRKFVERIKENRGDIKNHKQSAASSRFSTNSIGCRIGCADNFF